ncbi:hypothetical protein HIM_04840 [Hirsutella minnesotensis 3608]|uniref:RING-type E3 ubiquitin transferase n=1 Tax=Hirsutella minnesotensis 3608 TaxID=1043627 RepID=A0A0F7ZUY7_9HYPO|nr:hypothetical protein HIM_04840 [Hirsutella minnesotensis 3608]
MPKMRLGWYAGVSTALATGVVISAFHQRANFYSAMVYLAQSNFCLLALVNFSLLLYSSFVYGLTRLCYGTLRAVEVEQLTERAWFAITETCLAMTIFREEIGAWFLVMFTALVTGKVWGWIGDGRVEFLEQQPPPNPRLFHIRLSVSLAMSFLYDIWILRYSVHNVIQQARPNMMVMFLFEFAVLATCSWRTGARYVLVLAEQNIIKAQTRKRLLERRQEVREQREAMIRQRQQASASGEDTTTDDRPLPSEDDIDEMDIEVPGWAAKGEWVLWLDLLSDMIKLGIYVAFFFMLLMFYGLPIHIMRDLFMTSRDFVKRLHALLRYRRAIQEMNRYADATAEDLAQESTCIICREEMRPWDPVNNPGAIDRVRPKKLPCGHILHLGCLKSWLERQQVCPTCRSPVTADRARGSQNGTAGLRIQIGAGARPQAEQPAAGNDVTPGGQGRHQEAPQPEQPRERGPRIFNLGPIRVGFGANGHQVRELAQQFGIPQVAGNHRAPTPTPTQNQSTLGENLQSIGNLLQQSEQMVPRELQRLQMAQQELQIAHLLMAELQRLQQRRQNSNDQPAGGQAHQPSQPMSSFVPIPGSGAPQPTMPTAGMQPPFQGLPMMTSAPARSASPYMARLGASGNTAAIPAGSAELPDGMTLPPGWSLMPLQRLDGPPHLANPAPQPGMPVNGDSSQTHTSSTTEPTPVTDNGSRNGEAPSTEAINTEAVNIAPQTHNSAHNGPSTVFQGVASQQPAGVMAPSPMMPSWGSSAQLFQRPPRDAPTPSRSIPSGAMPPQEGSHENLPDSLQQGSETGSSTAAASHEQERLAAEEGEPAAPSSSKDKGKAVTMEEVRDDEN